MEFGAWSLKFRCGVGAGIRVEIGRVRIRVSVGVRVGAKVRARVRVRVIVGVKVGVRAWSLELGVESL